MALPEAGVTLVAEGLAQFTNDIGQANKAVADFGQSGGSAGSAFDKGFSEIVVGGLRRVGELGVEALAKAAQAVGQFVGDSIGLAGDFEAGMLNFQAVAGKSVDTAGLEQFRDLFIQLGKELPVSTSEVQQAAAELVKGGIDPAIVAAGGLRQNIQFAAAAMEGDLVAAAEVSSKILGGWASASATAQEKADFLTHATDQLTKAANASSVDVHELSLGIFNAQGTAKTAGVSFDDLTTTLAELAPRFASASEAGNSLKNFIVRLQPTTKPAIAAMDQLGLMTTSTTKIMGFLREQGITPLGTDLDTLGNQFTEFAAAQGLSGKETTKIWESFAQSKFFDEATGKFIGMQQASQLLQDATLGLTDAQKTQALQQIFGNDAMNSAAALAELGAAGYDQMAASLANANGVADAAALKQQGFNTALDNAKGSVEALQITIGSALLPVLGSLLDNVVSPAINTLTDMADAIFGNDEAFNRLSPTAQAIVSVIDVLVADVQEVIGAFNDAGAMSSEFAESLGLLASDLGLPGDLVQDLAMGIQDLIDWFNKGGSASDGLADAVKDLSGIWEKAGQVVSNVLSGYQDIIDSVLPLVQRFIADHGEEIGSTFQSAWDSIIQIVNLALDLYDAIVPPILHAIASFIDDHGSEIGRIFSAAWDVISTVITGALDLIKGAIKLAIDVVHGDWEGAWKDIQGITDTIVKTISGAIEGFLNIIAGFFDTSLGEIARLWENNWNTMLDLITRIDWAQAGIDLVEGIKQGVIDAWGSFSSWLLEKAASLIEDFLAGWGAASPAKEWMPAGVFATQGIMEGFSQQWPALMKLVEGLGDDLIDKAISIGQSVQGAIADAFSSTASIDRQIAKNLDSLGKDVLPDYQDFTKGALKAAENEARAFLDPAEGAKYFQMRSKQILEYEKLRKDLAEAETSDDQRRIKAQMNLINEAQKAEISAFNANLNAGQSATESLMEAIQSLLATKVKTKDAKGKEVEVGLPSILDSPTIAAITKWLSDMSSYSPYSGYVNPPMTAQQQQYSGQTSYTSQRTYNMPIYTNNTPAALEQSMAIAQAVMP